MAAAAPTARNVLGDLVAAVLLVALLLLPDRLSRTDLGSFAAVPIEPVLGGVLLVVLPAAARRGVAIVLGGLLGVLTVLKIIDIGFYGALARPFDLVLDWTLLPGVWTLLQSSLGSTVGALVLAGAVALLIGVVAASVWATVRLAALLGRHRETGTRTLAALGACWLVCAAAGVRAVPPYPVASASSTTKIVGEVQAVRDGLADRDQFAAELAADRFRGVPADRLLAGLRGTQVLVIFVESYGRVALTDPRIAATVTPVLDEGSRRLERAGWQSRSGYLTSPTTGGGSWLAHATFLSGLWIDGQQRYRNLVASDRLTLTGAFADAGWRTVGIMPGNTSAWPDGDVYRYDEIRDSRTLGYAGPPYGWAGVPDQYTLTQAAAALAAGSAAAPSMVVTPLITSHAPWTPIPTLVDPAAVGDGSGLARAGGSAEPPEAILTRDPSRVSDDYGRSLAYSLGAVTAQLAETPPDDTVVIMVGDHQPAPVVAGPDAGRDVPITILSGDPEILDRVRGWDWTPGLRPAEGGPVWRMDTVRDRFLIDVARATPR